MASWTARFEAAELELPHDDASSSFSAAIVRPPEHTLTVKVIEKDTAHPVEEALVRLGAYRAETGRSRARRDHGCRRAVTSSMSGRRATTSLPTTLDLRQGRQHRGRGHASVPEEDPDAHLEDVTRL